MRSTSFAERDKSMKSCRLLTLAAAVAVCLIPAAAQAQFSGVAPANSLRDLSLLKPPTGHSVAIVVFEDLGCPACAHAHPIELQTAAALHVPIMRYDFPLQAHIWTFQGAVDARYIQEKISPQLADAYRTDVFAAQNTIANKDDLQRYTQQWLQHHGQQMPFVIDPDQSLAKAVQADAALGRRINVTYTPTIIVISRDKQQVVCGTGDNSYDKPENIRSVVEAALAQSKSSTTAGHAAHRANTTHD
jgi:protein-disulfide isomerase